MKKVIIKFERGGEVSAELLESVAPDTCKIIWDAKV
ncbi:DUF3830 family protein [Evansella halocellulosilytica]|nr:DUF3830 family protein [Evansella halocellulosilytica]